MKPNTMNQKILLFTGTSFTKQEFCSRDRGKEGKESSAMEQLERACWDGMLSEMMPELVSSPSAKSENFICHILSGKHFLRIILGPCQQMVENESSIDPYLFMLENFNN